MMEETMLGNKERLGEISGMEVWLRPIQPEDNAAIAAIIRQALAEFGANKPGTVYYDETTDHLYELFRQTGSAYFMAEQQGRLIGGGGIFLSAGLPQGTCELVKMYLKKEARGKGIGRMLIQQCMQTAKEKGYTAMYIETMPELRPALGMYEKCGFHYLTGPLGNTGHFGCDVWMLKQL
jgi:putative acetyltransferase